MVPADARHDRQPIHWLSTKEASERLGITLRSLYRFIDEGDLVAYKFGRVIRIQEADVERFIEASRIAPGEPRAPLSGGEGQRARPHRRRRAVRRRRGMTFGQPTVCSAGSWPATSPPTSCGPTS